MRNWREIKADKKRIEQKRRQDEHTRAMLEAFADAEHPLPYPMPQRADTEDLRPLYGWLKDLQDEVDALKAPQDQVKRDLAGETRQRLYALEEFRSKTRLALQAPLLATDDELLDQIKNTRQATQYVDQTAGYRGAKLQEITDTVDDPSQSAQERISAISRILVQYHQGR